MKQLLVVLLLFAPTIARAGVYIEPYAGYSLSGTYSEDRGPGTGAFSGVTVGTDSGKLQDAFTYGGKIGYGAETVFIGGDYQASQSKYTADNNKDQLKYGGNSPSFTSIGAMIGLKFGAFRIWAEDLISDKMSYTNTSNTKDDYSGSGLKVGVGLLLYSHINFNVEYVSHTYTKLESGTVSMVLPGTYNDQAGTTITAGKFEASSVLLSLSFPFGL